MYTPSRGQAIGMCITCYNKQQISGVGSTGLPLIHSFAVLWLITQGWSTLTAGISLLLFLEHAKELTVHYNTITTTYVFFCFFLKGCFLFGSTVQRTSLLAKFSVVNRRNIQYLFIILLIRQAAGLIFVCYFTGAGCWRGPGARCAFWLKCYHVQVKLHRQNRIEQTQTRFFI